MKEPTPGMDTSASSMKCQACEESDSEDYVLELANQPFIPVVKSWDAFEQAALEFLRERKYEELRQLANGFIKGSCDSTCKQKEKDQRRELLKFIYKGDFKAKPLDEQEALVKKTCSKERIYRELSDQFWEEIERVRAREKKLAIARKYDEIVRDGGLEIFQREKSFLDYAKEQIGEDPPRFSQAIRTKPRKKRQIEKYMANTLSPYSWNYLKLKTKKGEGTIQFIKKEIKKEINKEANEQREVTFEVKHLSEKSEMLIDFLFDRYAKKDNATLLKEKPKETDIITHEKFEEALQQSDNSLLKFTPIKFDSQEFRRHFGVRITDKEVQRAVNELLETRIRLEGVKIWCNSNGDGRGKHYRKITHNDRIIYSATVKKTGRVEHRTKAEQHSFRLTVGSGWAMIFHNDVINKRYACFSKKFYQASKKAKVLGRYLSCWRSSTLTIGQVSEIAEYKDTINLRKRKKDIEVKFDELKRIGVVKSWKRAKKNGRENTGEETAWNIKRA